MIFHVDGVETVDVVDLDMVITSSRKVRILVCSIKSAMHY